MLHALDAAERLMKDFGEDALSLAEHHLAGHVHAAEGFYWLCVADALCEMNAAPVPSNGTAPLAEHS